MSLESNQGIAQQSQQSEEVLREVKTGELWLIGVNVCLLIIQVITAAVYYKQLTQMRIATEASTNATSLASDSLLTNASQFDRSMQQIITQTAIDYRAERATTQAANSAKRAAQIANTTLHLSERAYISFEYRSGGIDYANHSVVLGLTNYGHIPPNNLRAVAHHAIFEAPKGVDAIVDFAGPGIRNWNTTQFVAIGTGDTVHLIIPFPTMVEAKMTSFQQLILIAGYVFFNDGFPEDGETTVPFCFKSQGNVTTKQVYLTPCDAAAVIPLMETKDGYPNNENK